MPEPVHFAAVLFPGFQLMDICSPLDALNILSYSKNVRLSIVGPEKGLVSTKIADHMMTPVGASAQYLKADYSYDEPPEQMDVIMVPGGYGVLDEAVQPKVVEFLKKHAPKAQYLFSICNGSMFFGKAGLLDGKKATGNKDTWDWVKGSSDKADWQPKARWVVDGNVITTSGVSAGHDGFLAFIGSVFGEDVADQIAKTQEYSRTKDPENDPFAVVYKL